jgi:hypothetical protein
MTREIGQRDCRPYRNVPPQQRPYGLMLWLNPQGIRAVSLKYMKPVLYISQVETKF